MIVCWAVSLLAWQCVEQCVVLVLVGVCIRVCWCAWVLSLQSVCVCNSGCGGWMVECELVWMSGVLLCMCVCGWVGVGLAVRWYTCTIVHQQRARIRFPLSAINARSQLSSAPISYSYNRITSQATRHAHDNSRLVSSTRCTRSETQRRTWQCLTRREHGWPGQHSPLPSPLPEWQPTCRGWTP